MADFQTGDTLVWWIGPYLDDSNNAVTGLTFTAITALKPDGTTFTPVYAEVGGGTYKATIVGDQAGAWFLHSRPSNSLYPDDAGTVTVAAAPAGNVALTTAPIALNGAITLYKAADYKAAESRALDWSTTDAGTWPDLTGATIAFAVGRKNVKESALFTVEGSVVTPTGATKHVRVEVSHSDTQLAGAGPLSYQVRATLSNTHIVPLAAGDVELIEYIG